MESLPQEYSSRSSARAVEFSGVARPKPPPDCTPTAAGAPTGEAANDTRMMSQLARTIEQEIIPRLMLAHRSAPPVAPVEAWGGQPITGEEVARFAKLILSEQEDLALAEVHAYRARQVPIENLYLDLLAPTARYLGDLWNEDLCNFTDVTVGLGRLQRVLRELSPAFGQSVEHPCDGRRVLLLPSPGEQHTFGLVMVSEFFRRAGWHVTGGAWVGGGDAGMMSGSEWFDVIGFSLGSEIHLGALAETIRSVRHATCNPDVLVLVGGPIFTAHPAHVGLVGADAMTMDGKEAPALAERLIAEKGERSSRWGARQQGGGSP